MPRPDIRICSLLLLAMLGSLLAAPTAPLAARPAAPPVDSPILTGRNCGSTVLLASSAAVQTASTTGVLAAPMPLANGNILAPVPDSVFDQVAVAAGQLTLEQSWTKNGPVDDVATSGQFAPSIAYDAAGAVVYAWSEQPNRLNDFGDIYFSASAATAPAQSRQAVRVDDRGSNADTQANPSLAITANGTFVILWADQRNGESDIYAATSSDQGQTWSANTQVHNSASPLTHRNPFLLAGAEDTLYAIWEASDADSNVILFSRSDDGGSTWSAEMRVNDNVPADVRINPALALLSDGNLIATWADDRNGETQIFVSSSFPVQTRTAWTTDVLVDATSTLFDRPAPDLAVGADGLVYLAYEKVVEGLPGIFFTRSADNGATWETSIRLSDSDVSAIGPSLDVNAAGEPSCGWCQSRSTSASDDVFFTRSLNAGQVWTQPVRVNDGEDGGTPPTLAVGPDGDVTLAWRDNRTGGKLLIYASDWPSNTYYAEGTYTSPVYDAGMSVPWLRLTWDETEPFGTEIALAVRVGDTPEPDETWSDWSEFASPPADLGDLPPGQYAQVRATLTTVSRGATPTLSNVLLQTERNVFLPIVLR